MPRTMACLGLDTVVFIFCVDSQTLSNGRPAQPTESPWRPHCALPLKLTLIYSRPFFQIINRNQWSLGSDDIQRVLPNGQGEWLGQRGAKRQNSSRLLCSLRVDCNNCSSIEKGFDSWNRVSLDRFHFKLEWATLYAYVIRTENHIEFNGSNLVGFNIFCIGVLKHSPSGVQGLMFQKKIGTQKKKFLLSEELMYPRIYSSTLDNQRFHNLPNVDQFVPVHSSFHTFGYLYSRCGRLSDDVTSTSHTTPQPLHPSPRTVFHIIPYHWFNHRFTRGTV
ncbi:hypothetical protein CBL_13061 [Carabus blaptoides fortunei]